MSDVDAFPLMLSRSRLGELRDALREHPLVLVRDLSLTPEGVLGLARELGEPEVSPRERYRVPGLPQLMRVGNVRDDSTGESGANAVRFGWHADNSYRRSPPEFTVLFAVETPARGGATRFRSLYRMYDELDEPTRERWARLRVEHVQRSPHFAGRDDIVNVHPLIRTHPESVRPLLYASPHYARRVLGLPAAASESVLSEIAERAEPADHELVWRPGDLVVWDNRAVIHAATEYDAERERRLLWRTLVRSS